jgi:hypothetical protein
MRATTKAKHNTSLKPSTVTWLTIERQHAPECFRIGATASRTGLLSGNIMNQDN